MPHPKKRKTKSGRNQRRSHHALKSFSLIKCKKCGKPSKSHYICPECGYYNGKKMVDISKKLSGKKRGASNKEKKKQEKPKEEKAKVEAETKK